MFGQKTWADSGTRYERLLGLKGISGDQIFPLCLTFADGPARWSTLVCSASMRDSPAFQRAHNRRLRIRTSKEVAATSFSAALFAIRTLTLPTQLDHTGVQPTQYGAELLCIFFRVRPQYVCMCCSLFRFRLSGLCPFTMRLAHAGTTSSAGCRCIRRRQILAKMMNLA